MIQEWKVVQKIFFSELVPELHTIVDKNFVK